jgi:hypothetical protein
MSFGQGKVVFYSTTLISGTKCVKNGVKGCPKRYFLHRVDHVTVSRLSAVKSPTVRAPVRREREHQSRERYDQSQERDDQ